MNISVINGLPYVSLITGCLLLWSPSFKPYWLVTVFFSLIAALYADLLEYVALPYIIVLIFVSIWYQITQRQSPHGIPALIALITLTLISLAFGAHWITGIHRLSIFSGIKASPDSRPFSLYFNFDKTLAGLVLLATATPIAANAQQWKSVLEFAMKGSLLAIFLILPLATLLGVIAWDPKLPSWLPVWLMANLFFTCIAEETFFVD